MCSVILQIIAPYRMSYSEHNHMICSYSKSWIQSWNVFLKNIKQISPCSSSVKLLKKVLFYMKWTCVFWDFFTNQLEILRWFTPIKITEIVIFSQLSASPGSSSRHHWQNTFLIMWVFVFHSLLYLVQDFVVI